MLAIWAAAVVAGAIILVLGSGVLVASDDFLTKPESKRVEELVAKRLPGAAAGMVVVVVHSPTRALGDGDGIFLKRLSAISGRIDAIGDEHVTGVMSAAGSGIPIGAHPGAGSGAAPAAAPSPSSAAPRMVSEDGHTALVLVTLAGNASQSEAHFVPIHGIVEEEDGRDGFDVSVTGGAAAEYETKELAESDLRRGELIGIPVALVILLFVFGAVAAALVPLALAVVAIVIASALTVVVGSWFDVSIFAVNIITMMGLAVGIDYSLLVVSRFREERVAGHDVRTAVARSAATASRAVFFSGGIVVVALSGMLIVPFSVLTSLGVGSILVVVAAVVAALTLLPAGLKLLGSRLDWLTVRRRVGRIGLKEERNLFWTRAATLIMRRPFVSLLTACLALALLAVPALWMETGMPGANEFPDGTSTKRAFTLLEEEFSAGVTSPILVSAEGRLDDPAVTAALERVRGSLADDDRFQIIGYQTGAAGDVAVLKVAVNADATSGAAMDAVHDLRRLLPQAASGAPVEILVGGVPALFVDGSDLIAAYTPWVIGLVLTMSFLLLLLAFRSLVIAVQSIIMNLLSVGAAYGLVTLVFQHGYATGILGFTQVEHILVWLPLLMFCVLFGLSMDYHIFLISRISERYAERGDTREAIVFGVGSTAGIITGAALIMVAVFAGVAMGEMTMFQQLGFGLAVAIAIDATVVRAVIVPSAMALLGEWSWYLPRWLEWLPHLNIEAPPATQGTAAPATAPTPDEVGAGRI
jgi:RND superfamily putative drug exporter